MVKKTTKFRVRRVIRRTGFDVIRFQGEFEHLQLALLQDHGIDLLLDVGANEGQYSQRMRQLGYKGTIAAFEPIQAVYRQLLANFAEDTAFQAYPYAVGEQNGQINLNVSANSMSSSVLPMAEVHRTAAPESTYVREELVDIKRLDSLELAVAPTWLKIDVQGAEVSVLEGAAGILDQVRVLQLELSLVPLYDGAALIEEVLTYLRQRDFRPVFIEQGFRDPRSGATLQVDGLFVST